MDMQSLMGKNPTELREIIIKQEKKNEKVKTKAEETMGVVVTAALTNGSAFAFAYARGRFDEGFEGDFSLVGIPYDLGVGIGLHVAGFFGVFGKYSEMGASVANGALSTYLVAQGLELGAEARQDAAEEDGSANQLTPAPQIVSSGRRHNAGAPVFQPGMQQQHTSYQYGPAGGYSYGPGFFG